MWQPSRRLDSSHRTLRLRLVDSINASGQVEPYPFVTPTTLFVLGVYKYVVAGSKGTLLVI
jgi:hypothetical protein